jgi:hypothetical protein
VTTIPETPAPENAAPSGRVPVIAAVREGFAFAARDVRALLPAALVAAVVVGGLQVWADVARGQENTGAMVAAGALSMIAQFALLAAYLRRALSEGAAPAALKAGRDEANLVGVAISLGFLYFILIVFALLFTGMALAALSIGADLDAEALQTLPPEEAARQFGAALGADGMVVLSVLVIGFVIFFLWIAARIVLSYPATVAEGRMFIFSTWSWTKGHDVRLVACLFLLIVGGIFLSLVALAPFGVALGLVFGEGAPREAGSPAHAILAVLAGLASAIFSTAPYAGMAAFLYRGLRPRDRTTA